MVSNSLHITIMRQIDVAHQTRFILTHVMIQRGGHINTGGGSHWLLEVH